MAGGATRRVSIYINEKEIEASMKLIKSEYAKTNAQLDKLIFGTEEYNQKAKKIRELKSIINEHNQNLGKTASTWEKISTKMMTFGAGMGGFSMFFNLLDTSIGKFKNLATEVAEMDDVFSDVQKTTQMSRDSVLDLNESFKKMDTRTAREELNKYAYIAGKLGIEQKDLVLEFVDGANIISVALSDALGDDAIELIGKIVNVYSKSTDILKGKSLKEQMLSVGSGLNVIGQTSTANEQYVVSFLGRLGGLSVQAKLAANNIMGYASALDQDMQAVELSTTAFQKLVKSIMSEPAKYAKIAGVEVKTFKKLIETDMNQAILKVLRGFSGTGGFTKLLPLFKDLGLDAERATQAISSMANSVDKIEEAQRQANQAMTEGTSVINEYNIKNNNMQAELEKSRKSFKDKRMELGEKLYPVLIKVTKSSTALVKGIGGLFKVMSENKELIITLSVLYGAYLLRLLQVSLAKKGLTTHTVLLSKVQALQTTIVEALKLKYYQLTGQTLLAAKSQEALAAASAKVPWMAVATVILIAGNALWKLATRQSKAAKEMEEFNKKVSDKSAGSITLIEELAYKWSLMGENMEEKEKFIAKNKDSFEKLGVAINSVADAETLLVSQKDAFISMLIEKAYASAFMEKAQDIFKNNIEITQKWVNQILVLQQEIDSLTTQMNDLPNTPAGAAAMYPLKQRINDLEAFKADYQGKIDAVNRDAINLIKRSNEISNNVNKTLSRTGLTPIVDDSKTEETTSTNNNITEPDEETLKKWDEFLKNLEKLKEDARINSYKDLDKEKETIKRKYDEQIKQAQEFAAKGIKDAKEKINVLEGLKNDELKIADQNFRQKELEKHQKALEKLGDTIISLETKMNGAFNNKYANELIDARNKWDQIINDLDDSINYYLDKQDETYDPVLGTGLSEDEVKLLEKLLNKKKQAIDSSYKEELDIVTRAEKEVSEAVLSEKEKQIKDIEDFYKDKISIARTAIDELKKVESEENKNRIAELEKQIAELQAKLKEDVDKVNNGDSSVLAKLFGTQGDWDKIKDLWKDNFRDILNEVQIFAANIEGVVSNIYDIQSNNETSALNEYSQNIDSRKEQLEKMLNQGLISQTYYNSKISEMDKELSLKQKQLELDKYKREKRAAISKAIISGILSAIESFKNGGGWPWGLIPAGLSVAFTGTQIAAIASEPEPYATGGFIDNEKIIRIAEKGPEWVASNTLLKDKKTSRIITALDQYQKGNKSMLNNIEIPQPNSSMMSLATRSMNRNFESQTLKNDTVQNYYIDNEKIGKLYDEFVFIRKYLTDPKNRQATISRDLLLEFENDEEFLRNRAKF
jgi:hypothetical protein